MALAPSRKSELLAPAVKAFLIRRLFELAGLAVAAFGAAIGLALLAYSPTDPSLNVARTDAPVANLLGLPGAYAADFLAQSLGGAAFLLAAAPLVWGWRVARQAPLGRLWLRVPLLLAATLFVATALADAAAPTRWTRAEAPPPSLGGFAGQLLNGVGFDLLAAYVDESWRWAIEAGLFLVGAGLFVAALGVTAAGWREAGNGGLALLRRGRARSIEDETPEEQAAPKRRRAQKTAAERRAPSLELSENPPLRARRPGGEPPTLAPRFDEDEDGYGDDASAAEPSRPLRIARPPAPPQPAAGRRSPAPEPDDDFDAPVEHELPPIDLLQRPDPAQRVAAMDEGQLRQNAQALEGVLSDFGVRGQIVSVHPGPVVTLYELEPAPGVKSSRVIGLADDIARSMSAVSVRVAVVPGRNVIGVEMPNRKREVVLLRELFESAAYADSQAKLALVLGKDIGGGPVIADLARMPHLLVAGTTGSGKSVAINVMILSLLYRLPPEKCRFIMVDPKMLELSVYDGIPHLLSPVVTDPKKAVVALKWTVREMETRYRNMSKLGVRNIDGYNARLREARENGEVLTRRVQTGFDPDTGKPVFEDEPLDLTELPYIVVIVDEMADLMLVAGKDIEAAIQRLAQMARAAGIHLIMATQRPSVDVITGTIKANFPTRISFQVTSKIDSRTILGEQGAEQLLGQGDMLHMAGGGRITRVHGPFVRDDEVEQVVRFLKAQGAPQYVDDVTEDLDESMPSEFAEGGGGGGSGDDLYDRAVALVCRERKASTSFVQRHLQIGYNRAARLIERMESEGVVSAANHVGKREVLARNIEE